MEITWLYRYVPEGQLEPDKHNRWAVDGHIWVNIKKALPEYSWIPCGEDKKGKMAVRIATIVQKGTLPGEVPSVGHRFCACIPSFKNPGDGLADRYYFYGNTIEEVKVQVKEQFELMQLIFKNCD